MKKNLLFVIAVLFIQATVYVFAGTGETLSKIENNIYGFDYSNDNNNSRVSRLEKTIYGKSSSGDINKRLKRLSGDVSADVIGLEIPAVRDTFLAEEEIVDSSVDYPIVNEIEQKLFNQTYKNRDFHTRIVTIEKKLFGKIYDVEDYSTRMDRIKSKMMPEIASRSDDNLFKYGDGSYYTGKDIDEMEFAENNLKRWNMPFGQKNYTRPYTNFGEYGNSINGKNLDDELAQMEYDIFGTSFPDESPNVRMKRLNSVNKAKKSTRKYDSQKFSQHVSTAMEIGAMILMILAMVL